MDKKQENRRVKSITKKLHWSYVKKKIRMYLFFDLFLFVLSVFGFLCLTRYGITGKLSMEFQVQFLEKDTGWEKDVTYVCFVNEDGSFMSEDELKHYEKEAIPLLKKMNLAIASNTGELVFREIYEPFRWVFYGLLAFLIIPLFHTFLNFYHEDHKIKTILQPINEMAMKVDELSKLTMSEERYHEIENALDTIDPLKNESLSLGNQDLKGIEAAMNNLIIRMRDTYRQQSRFVNDASHELRTPITVIQGYVNMLDRWGKEDEKILEESIDAIKNETDHMQHLVEQLLFLARGDSGKTMLKYEEFEMNAMVREVYEESLMIDEAHVYRLKEPDEICMYRGDLGLLKQACRILVDNAAKYTKKGDEIIIGLGKDQDNCLYIQVQDTGIGMAEKDVANMFERFYRSDEVRSIAGTGLGLSIAKWIVDKHKGHFDILSRTELGTRIRIMLPQ